MSIGGWVARGGVVEQGAGGVGLAFAEASRCGASCLRGVVVSPICVWGSGFGVWG